MAIRVATQDMESAKRLVAELAGVFGGECVALHPDGEIEVRPADESNQAVIHSLEAVERWLEATRIASAEVSVDGRYYTVRQPGSLVRVLNGR
jgi:hypothetical protein